MSKFQLGVENFVRRNILSVENLFNISIQKSGKNWTKLSKFRLGVENFVQYFNTKDRQKSDKAVEISAWCRNFCPTKLLSDEILSDKMLARVSIIYPQVTPNLSPMTFYNPFITYFRLIARNYFAGSLIILFFNIHKITDVTHFVVF